MNIFSQPRAEAKFLIFSERREAGLTLSPSLTISSSHISIPARSRFDFWKSSTTFSMFSPPDP